MPKKSINIGEKCYYGQLDNGDYFEVDAEKINYEGKKINHEFAIFAHGMIKFSHVILVKKIDGSNFNF